MTVTTVYIERNNILSIPNLCMRKPWLIEYIYHTIHYTWTFSSTNCRYADCNNKVW